MRLVWSAEALADLNRFADFLSRRHPQLADRIAGEIIAKTAMLIEHPRLGHPLGDNDTFRELVLRVLKAQYVFQYELGKNELIILRVFHGRESRTGK